MATAQPWQGKTVQIPAVYSDISGVSWRTQSAATGVNTHSSTSKSRPQQYTTEHEVMVAEAVAVIESWWWRTKNRKVFRILKETIRSAERSLTNDVIRKVCPAEAELLKDPTMKTKIKFRFGGERFPPMIMFKIFISSTASGVKYLSGKKMIRPASDAARDAQRGMGSRVFYDQMLVDVCQQQQFRITDEIDVTTMKEYMQYVSTVDETPAYLGGKDNTWRKLNLEALPRHSVMYSVLELLERCSGTGEAASSGGLSLEKLRSFTRLATQMEQIQRIKTVSSLRTGEGERCTSRGSRGSKIARLRARKMREMYGTKSPSTPQHSQSGRTEGESEGEGGTEEGEAEDSDIEKEASELYEWTQNLSFEDVQ